MTVPIKRPKVSRNPEIVVGRILDAAEAEFMQSGFEAASTNRITEAFGGSKATLFRYYKNKEGLLAAVIERISVQWSTHIRWADGEPQEPRSWLIGFSKQTLAWILSEPVLFIGRLGISEGARLPDLKDVFSHFAAEPLHDVVSDRLNQWMKAGVILPGNAQDLASHFMDLVVSGPVSRALYGVERLEGGKLELHVMGAVDLFLNGCVARSVR